MSRDIADAVLALKSAIENDDEKIGAEAALLLLQVALDDLHRIADALEILARPPAE